MTIEQLEREKEELEAKLNKLERQIKDFKEKLKSKRWKPSKGEKYYFGRSAGVDSYGLVGGCAVVGDETDNFRNSIGNCFKTQEEAEFAIEQLKVLKELKDFADDNDKEWNCINRHHQQPIIDKDIQLWCNNKYERILKKLEK